MEPIKTGTFFCWAFGHRFIKELRRDDEDFNGNQTPGYNWTRTQRASYCFRCGFDNSPIVLP